MCWPHQHRMYHQQITHTTHPSTSLYRNTSYLSKALSLTPYLYIFINIVGKFSVFVRSTALVLCLWWHVELNASITHPTSWCSACAVQIYELVKDFVMCNVYTIGLHFLFIHIANEYNNNDMTSTMVFSWCGLFFSIHTHINITNRADTINGKINSV